MIQNSGGDHIFNTIQTVIKEVSKGLEKVVDLQKLKALSPEAQAAEIAKEPVQEVAHVEAPPQAPKQETSDVPIQRQEAQTAPAKPEARMGESENRIEMVIRKNLEHPDFQAVLSEWALHVENSIEEGKIDATPFANFYLEKMRDPRDDDGRQGCAAFATFMRPRSWKKMLEVFRGAVGAEIQATFDKPEAEEFYKQFKTMVIEQIKEYWEQFLASRQQQAQAKQGGNGTPASQAPVEPQGAPQAQSAVASGQTP